MASRYNSERYYSPTEYEAFTRIEREERDAARAAAGFAEHGTEEQFLAPQRRCRKCLLLSRRNQLRRSTHTVHGFHRFLRQYRKFPRVCTVKPAAEPAGCTGFGRKNLSQHA